MTITFYNTPSDPRKVEKVLRTSTGSAIGVLHERVNSISMVVRLPGTCYNIVTQSNYVMLDLTQKYYFIEGYDVQNDCCYINLREDVLMSYKTQIEALRCTVARTESETRANAYLIDPQYKAKAYKKYVQRLFPNSVENWSYILMTVG